ncbi:MAG: hypothetical protein Ta2E_10900 [Mycoplasmoidaceae bacterium]|nr:MAG: hypothetical protein Ta2E_10900 [Mycoplasmoidaceae bacterium]
MIPPPRSFNLVLGDAGVEWDGWKPLNERYCGAIFEIDQRLTMMVWQNEQSNYKSFESQELSSDFPFSS